MPRLLHFLKAAIFLSLTLVSLGARAATIVVCGEPDCDFDTIQEAIDAASPGDTIVVNEPVHTEAGIDVTKNLTIKGLGQDFTILQASPDAPPDNPLDYPRGGPDSQFPGRVFRIGSGVEAAFIDLTVRHGFAPFRGNGGGGILNFGSLTLISVTVERNASMFHGGGIENAKGANLNIQQSRIQNNSAGFEGAGVYNSRGTVRLVGGSVLQMNKSRLDGAGIWNGNGDLFVDSSSIMGNQIVGASAILFGGGISSSKGSVTINDGKILDNQAGSVGQGGGMSAHQSRIAIAQSVFRNNSARLGGGLSIKGGEAFIIDTTVDRNNATLTTGGLLNRPGAIVEVRSSTISRNSSPQIENSGDRLRLANSTISAGENSIHEGIRNEGDSELEVVNSTIANHSVGISFGGTAKISNSIVADNTTNCIGQPEEVTGPNLSSDHSCVSFSLKDANADLGLLRNNGGETETHALGPASEAKGAGDNGICNAAPISGEDQRGVVRPQPLGSDCDLGAYEASATGMASLNLQFSGDGKVTATSPLGTCDYPGFNPPSGDCSGDVAAGEQSVTVTPAAGSEIGSIGPCDATEDGDDGAKSCTKNLAPEEFWEVETRVVPRPKLAIRSHESGTGEGTVKYCAIGPCNFPELVCDINPMGETSPAPCETLVSDPGPGVIEAEAGDGSIISAWTEGCDPAPDTWISEDGTTGQCKVSSAVGNLTVTIKIDLEAPAVEQPQVVATVDQTACGDGENPGFKNLRFLKGVLVAVAQAFDALSNVIQCAIRFDVNTGEGPALMQQTGDMGEFGIVEFFLALGLFDREIPVAHIKERLADDTTIEVLGRFVNDVFQAFLWQGLAVNPTVESFDKIAANDPYFVVQAQFQAEGPGLIAADIAVDPALLAVVFHAGDSVGDGFAFESFHAGAVPGIALNPLGDGAVVADVVDTTSGAVVDGLLSFRADTPGANLLLRQGQETEFPGVFISQLANVAMDSDGVIAVLGRVFGTGITSGNDEAVWVCIAALCDIMVQEGMEPEGMPGVRLRFPGSPIVRGGKLLMRTVLEGTGIDSTNNFGLLLVDLVTGAVDLVGQKGEAFAGDTIADFTSKAFSNNIPLVTVRLNGGFGRALARIEGGGLVPEIVPGDQFTLPDGTVGIVSGIIDITESGGEDGRPSAFGGGGYAIVVFFEDGRSGIVACTAACL